MRVIDISKFENIVQKVCKIYFFLFIVFLAIQPDLRKTVYALTGGSRIIAENYNIFLLMAILITMMGIAVYKRRRD